MPHSKDDDDVSMEEEAKKKPAPPKVPEKPKTGRQAPGSYTAHDFDYVTRQIKTLDVHVSIIIMRYFKNASIL